MTRLAKSTAIKCCYEFFQELCSFQNEGTKFSSPTADAIIIEGFSMKRKVANLVTAVDGIKPCSYSSIVRQSQGLFQSQTLL